MLIRFNANARQSMAIVNSLMLQLIMRDFELLATCAG